MVSRGCASNKIAAALIAVVVFAAAVTLMRVYGADAHGAQGKTAVQASLKDCAAVPVAVKLIEDGEARAVYETDDAELVASTFAALDGCTVGDAVDERMSDAGRTLVFVYADGSEQSVELEGKNIVLDKTAYRLNGADELWRQLAAIKSSQRNEGCTG